MLNARFLPSPPQRELRELTRDRTRLVQERAREGNRLQKTLEETTLKWGDVVSAVMGNASQRILHAVVDGETDPQRLASFAVGRVRASRQELERALTGNVTAPHRFLLGEPLKPIATMDGAIGSVSQDMARRFAPPEDPTEEERGQPASAPPAAEMHEQARRLPSSKEIRWQNAAQRIDDIPGRSAEAAQGILAAIGIEMEPFPSASHGASWAGVCPDHQERAGKRLSGKARKGHPWFRRNLVQAAHAAGLPLLPLHSTGSRVAGEQRRQRWPLLRACW